MMLNLVLATCSALLMADRPAAADRPAGGRDPAGGDGQAAVKIVVKDSAASPASAEPETDAALGVPAAEGSVPPVSPREAEPAEEAPREPKHLGEAPDGTTGAGDTDGPATGTEPPADQASDKLSPALAALRLRIRTALAIYYRYPVNSRDHCPWEVMHWVLAYGVDSQIRADGPSGPPQTAVGWLCFNRPCRNQRLLSVERDRVVPLLGAGLQGHDGQLLAILAQARVPQDYPIRIGNASFTVADLVESEKLGCRSGSELTFRLIGLAHYLESEARWKNHTGQLWSIPALIREEIQKPIRGAACGGTHRLMGLSYAVRMRQKRGEPVDGEYQRAQAYVQSYQRYTLGLQNRDGSFSTAWFERREARRDVDRRVQTTGHILEWMVYSLSEDELQDPRISSAAGYLASTLLENRNRDWKLGPLGHALRSLALYDRRVFVPLEKQGPESLAQRPAEPSAEPASGRGPPALPPAAPLEPSHESPWPQASQPGSPQDEIPAAEAPPAGGPAAETPPTSSPQPATGQPEKGQPEKGGLKRPAARRPAGKKPPAGRRMAP